MTRPAPEIPPSIEHLAHECRRWLDTPVARQLQGQDCADVWRENLVARLPDVPPKMLGEILLRLASVLANEPDLPLWFAMNTLGVAGADLIDPKDPS